MPSNLQSIILREVSALIQPLLAAAVSDDQRNEIFESLGWDLRSINDFPIANLIALLEALARSSEQLLALVEDTPTSFGDFQRALETARGLYESIRTLPTILTTSGRTTLPQFEAIGQELISYLVIRYLHEVHPQIYHLAVLLTIIQPWWEVAPSASVLDESGNVVRWPNQRSELRLSRISDLFTNPIETLKAEYIGTTGLLTAEDSRRTSDKLFPRLIPLLNGLGMRAKYGIDLSQGLNFGTEGEAIVSKTLTFLSLPLIEGFNFGASLTLSSVEEGNLGLVIVPFGTLNVHQEQGLWRLDLDFTTTLPGFAIGPSGLTLPDAPSTTSVSAQAQFERLSTSPGEVALLIGGRNGTRLEIGRLNLTVDASLNAIGANAGIKAETTSAVLVVSAGDGDGFLRHVLPQNGLRTNFDLGLGWSSQRGVYFRGSAGLEARITQHTTIGPLLLESLHLSLSVNQAGLRFATSITGGIRLGPLTAIIDRVGIAADVQFRDGNLGPIDLRLGLKPPNGVGLSISAGGVVGGGSLLFNHEQQEYVGVLQLAFGNITFSATGILTTRLPDGSDGFSLLLIISGEFPPIQLGFGFMLVGLGGLLALNRAANAEALQAGVRNRTLDSLLFPRDPVRNISTIVSNLRQVFPAERDRFMLGPMARIVWGRPTQLVTINLGIIVELGTAPVRLIKILLLGQLKVRVPNEESPLIVLNMDIIGIIDFEAKRASLDAVLYDSRVAAFTVSGEMAFRISWGESPVFALSIGGLHPRFQPPPNFPTLRRLAISLGTGDNPRIRLEAYLALTSNTFQVGARLDLYASISVFSIEGYLFFDALFQFSPFQFEVAIGAGVTLRAFGVTLLAVQLEFVLSGPSPWRARGMGRVQVLMFEVHVQFDFTFGQAETLPAPPTVDLWPLLREALVDRRSWTAQLPAAGHSLVSLREVSSETHVLAHPLGTMAVQQKVVPLDLEVTRFGSATLSGERRFTIAGAQVGGRAAASTPIRDSFAAAQFLDLTDDEKLSRPSFEQMQAGTLIGAANLTCEMAQAVSMTAEYEEIVVDERTDLQWQLQSGALFTLPTDAFLVGAGLGALSALDTTGAARYRGASMEIALHEPVYTIASTADLSSVTLPGIQSTANAQTMTANVTSLRSYIAQHSRAHEEFQVVAHYEARPT